MLLPKFVDHHPGYTDSGFCVTNEEPEVFNAILGKQKFDRVACIASGGEILLFCLLHRAKEVVAIDHSYLSIGAAYTKALLFQQMKHTDIRKLMLDENYTEILKQIADVNKHVPAPAGITTPRISQYSMPSLRKEWAYGGLRRFSKKQLGSITFIHGDVRDLQQLYQPFDLLYVSNVLEHSPRDRAKLSLGTFAPLLNEGGLLLYTEAIKKPLNDPSFEHVKTVHGYRTAWYHHIVRKVMAAAAV